MTLPDWCVECGEPMHLAQKRRHHLCDPTGIVGRACVCPPGCSDQTIGDQGTCSKMCDVCRIRHSERCAP